MPMMALEVRISWLMMDKNSALASAFLLGFWRVRVRDVCGVDVHVFL